MLTTLEAFSGPWAEGNLFSLLLCTMRTTFVGFAFVQLISRLPLLTQKIDYNWSLVYVDLLFTIDWLHSVVWINQLIDYIDLPFAIDLPFTFTNTNNLLHLIYNWLQLISRLHLLTHKLLASILATQEISNAVNSKEFVRPEDIYPFRFVGELASVSSLFCLFKKKVECCVFLTEHFRVDQSS